LCREGGVNCSEMLSGQVLPNWGMGKQFRHPYPKTVGLVRRKQIPKHGGVGVGGVPGVKRESIVWVCNIPVSRNVTMVETGTTQCEGHGATHIRGQH